MCFACSLSSSSLPPRLLVLLALCLFQFQVSLFLRLFSLSLSLLSLLFLFYFLSHSISFLLLPVVRSCLLQMKAHPLLLLGPCSGWSCLASPLIKHQTERHSRFPSSRIRRREREERRARREKREEKRVPCFPEGKFARPLSLLLKLRG